MHRKIKKLYIQLKMCIEFIKNFTYGNSGVVVGYNGLAMRSVPKGIAYRFCCA